MKILFPFLLVTFLGILSASAQDENCRFFGSNKGHTVCINSSWVNGEEEFSGYAKYSSTKTSVTLPFSHIKANIKISPDSPSSTGVVKGDTVTLRFVKSPSSTAIPASLVFERYNFVPNIQSIAKKYNVLPSNVRVVEERMSLTVYFNLKEGDPAPQIFNFHWEPTAVYYGQYFENDFPKFLEFLGIHKKFNVQETQPKSDHNDL